jgi:hypothetical protein
MPRASQGVKGLGGDDDDDDLLLFNSWSSYTDTVFGLTNSLHREELGILRKIIYYLKYY